MSILMAAVLLTGVLCGQDGDPAPQEQNVTWPKFIVVFRYQPKPSDPLVDLRVVLRARSEGDATVRALLHLQKTFNDIEKMEFVEAVEKLETPPAPPVEKPKEKK